jgi:hypothetical protein
MFERWVETHAILRFHVDSVNLKRRIDSDFQLTWTRGSHKGETEIVQADPDAVLHFNCDFQIKCTMYSSQKSGKVRPKSMTILLNRFLTHRHAATTGKLDLDLGTLFKDAEPQTRQFPMESSRTSSPILSASFTFARPRSDSSAEPDQAAPSNSPERASAPDPGHSGHHKRRKISESSSNPTINPLRSASDDFGGRRPSIAPPRVQLTPSASKPSFGHIGGDLGGTRQHSSGIRSRGESYAAITLEVKSPLESHHSSSDGDDDPNISPLARAAVITRRASTRGAAPEIEDSEPDGIQKLRDILTKAWPPADQTAFIDRTHQHPFPAAAFPIFGALEHFQMFDPGKVAAPVFATFSTMFFEEFENAPLSQFSTMEDRFLTTILVSLFVYRIARLNQAAGHRARAFRETLDGPLMEITDALLEPFLGQFDELSARFSSAHFDAPALIEDFSQVLDGFIAGLKFAPQVTKFLLARLADLIDVRFANRILENPADFSGINGVTWLSCISALEDVEEIRMPNLRQVVSVMAVAPSLTDASAAADVYREVCPDLEPKLVCAILRALERDATVDAKIDPRVFANEFGIRTIALILPIPPPKWRDCVFAAGELDLSHWNEQKYAEGALAEFPWLAEFQA